MADTDFTLVKHTETGGFWRCPNGALEEMQRKGWEPTDEVPREPNPAVDERIAWEAEQARQREQQQAEQTPADAAATPDTTTPAARGEDQE